MYKIFLDIPKVTECTSLRSIRIQLNSQDYVANYKWNDKIIKDRNKETKSEIKGTS